MDRICDRIKTVFKRIGEVHEVTIDPNQLEYLRAEMSALKVCRAIVKKNGDDVNTSRLEIISHIQTMSKGLGSIAGRGGCCGCAMALALFHDNDNQV